MEGDEDCVILCDCGYLKLKSTVVCDICFNQACKSDLIWLDDD